MLYRSKLFGTGLKGGILLTTVVFGLAQEVLATAPVSATTSLTNSHAPVAPLILSGRQSDRPAGTYSAGVTEIIKLLEARVDAQVILAYIQNSTIPYNPDATELIALKEHGASTELLVALLHRGDELRLRLAQAQSAVNPQPAAPAYDYAPEAANPAYPATPSPDSVEVPYPATYYGSAYGWPLAYWPLVRINGYRPYGYPRGGFYAPSRGHTSSPVVHSGGSRGSGRSGGRSGGRSR